ncbi:hypothetical protein CEW92_14825 [Bacillaceae bacterium SAS-127]|nr:hypothetical protein CEW92_14825 [Bacillaceae bacterium SAS-127]
MSNKLDSFMTEHFNSLQLRPALFYNWPYGIRFEISMPWIEYEDKENLQQIKERSIGLFNDVFHATDDIWFITDVHCEKNDHFLQKRPTKVYQKYIKDNKVAMKLQHKVFAEEDIVTHRFILPCKKSDIRYHQLLSAISYEDFPHPTRILNNYDRAGYNIYFVNITKKFIYHLYDDRGCDVVASNKEDLRPLYKERYAWILDYDREQIDKLFK